MADLLALSWDRNRLTGAEISPSSAGPRIGASFSVDWPEQPPTAAWIRETLVRAGVTARQVVLALPREDIVLRLLELPLVSNDELPTLVRFQAAARSTQSLDQLLLDFLPLPERTGVNQKDVWLATTPLTTVAPIRALLTEAGLEISQLTLSSMCLAELIARGEARQSMSPASASLVVVRDGARMELAVVCQRQLIAAHAVKWSSISDVPPVAKMLAEVSRVLVQVQAWLPQGTLQRAWVIGNDVDVGELPAALAQRWNCPVERFDPLRDADVQLGSAKLAGPSSQFAVVAGLALIQSGPITPKLDLLHPRQPPPKRDPRKPLYAAAAAAVLLIVTITAGIISRSLLNYDQLIEEALTKESRQKDDLAKGEPALIVARELADWKARNINQLDQLAELYEVMNGTDQLIFADYIFEPNASSDAAARIRGYGYAKDRVDAERLYQRLAQLPKFQNNIKPKQITDKSNDSEYDTRFELETDVAFANSKTSAPSKPR